MTYFRYKSKLVARDRIELSTSSVSEKRSPTELSGNIGAASENRTQISPIPKEHFKPLNTKAAVGGEGRTSTFIIPGSKRLALLSLSYLANRRKAPNLTCNSKMVSVPTIAATVAR